MFGTGFDQLRPTACVTTQRKFEAFLKVEAAVRIFDSRFVVVCIKLHQLEDSYEDDDLNRGSYFLPVK